MADAGNVHLEQVASKCWLLRFDKDGACVSPETRAALLASLGAQPPGRVVLISHGWNSDFGDAVDLYTRFMRHVETLVAGDPDGTIVVVGVLWPSSLAPADKGPVIAGTTVIPDNPSDPARMLVDAIADRAARDAIETLLGKPVIDANEAEALARYVTAALRADGAGAPSEAVEDNPDSIDVLAAMRALASAGEEEPDWDAWTTAPAEGAATTPLAGGPAAASLFGIDPIMAVRVFTVYQMKDRAGRVGTQGVRALLDDLLAQTHHKIHCVGHSYGCKVLLSAVCRDAPPIRPVESMLLLEPAISHLCFAATVPGRAGPGGYRAVLSEAYVVQPLYSTYSRWDMPLHTIFHLALRRAADLGELRTAAGEGTSAGVPPSVYCALGGYGPRGAGEALIDPLPAAGTTYQLAPGHRMYAFDGSADKRIAGHGDVSTAATGWALVEQMRT